MVESLAPRKTPYQEDIQKTIMAGNRTCFAFIKHFRLRLMSKDTKMKLYGSHKTSGHLWYTGMVFENYGLTGPQGV
jgi:hypothetical protein